jgi:hypothetical protein
MKTLNVTNESEVPKGTKTSGKNPFTLVGWNQLKFAMWGMDV